MWQAASWAVGNSIILCGPADAACALARLASQSPFWISIAATAANVALGFAIAVLAGAVLGVACSRWRVAALLLEPAVSLMKSVPIVCIIVLLLIWLGAKGAVPAAVVLAVLPAVFAATVEGLRHVDPQLRALFKVHRCGLRQRVFALWWPAMQPYLKAAMRTAVGMSWKSGVAAELIGLPLSTMGEGIYQAKITLSTDEVLAWTFAVVVLAAVCEKLIVALLDRSGGASLRLAVPAFAPASASAAEPAEGEVLVELDRAAADFGAGPVCVLPGVFRIRRGDVILLNQPSGEGKTTTLSLVAGLRKPDAGHVRRISALRESAVFQQTALVDGLSAVDNVLLCAHGAVSPESARSLLSRVLPHDALDRPVGCLSGGQRRRVELCRAIASPGDMLLLDEPFSGLDDATVSACLDLLLAELHGRALVVSSHHRLVHDRIAPLTCANSHG